jgi:hypothetical protein
MAFSAPDRAFRPSRELRSQRRFTQVEPRLVADGDVKGGRYVSNVVDLYVGAGPAS